MEMNTDARDAGYDYFDNRDLKLDLKKHALKSGGISLVSRVVNGFIGLGGTVILARLLTPDDFGLIAMANAIINFFYIFKELGLMDATIQKEKITHAQISTVFWINTLIGILIMAIIILVSPLIANFYGNERLKNITIVLAFTFVFAGISTQHQALLKRNMMFLKIAFVENIAAALSTIIAVYFAVRGYGYWSLIGRMVSLVFFTALGSWIFCSWRPGLPVPGSGVKSMVTFGANTTGLFFVNYFVSSLDKTMIGKKYGAGDLGYYDKAYNLNTVPVSQFSGSLFHVAVTTLSKLRNDRNKYIRYYLGSLSTISFFGLPVIAYLVVISGDIIPLLLGPQWSPSAILFAILGIGSCFHIIYSTYGWLHVSLGRADRWLRWGIMSSFGTVFAYFIGLRFGSIGVAVSYASALAVLTLPGIVYAGQPIGLKYRVIIGTIWRYYFATIIAGFLCFMMRKYLLINADIIYKLIFIIIMFYIFYFAILATMFLSIKPIIKHLTLLKETVNKVMSLKK
jgi:O-antigen/teichoic acid export membrane protein